MPSRDAWKRLYAIEGLVKIPKPMPSRTWYLDHEARDAKIIAALKSGTSAMQVATQFGLSHDRIRQIANRYGFSLMDRYRAQQAEMHRERQKTIRALEAKRVPIKDIARQLGVSRDIVEKNISASYAQGDGIRRWWAEKTPEERSRLMAARQAKRTDKRAPLSIRKLTPDEMTEWVAKSKK